MTWGNRIIEVLIMAMFLGVYDVLFKPFFVPQGDYPSAFLGYVTTALIALSASWVVRRRWLRRDGE